MSSSSSNRCCSCAVHGFLAVFRVRSLPPADDGEAREFLWAVEEEEDGRGLVEEGRATVEEREMALGSSTEEDEDEDEGGEEVSFRDRE